MRRCGRCIRKMDRGKDVDVPVKMVDHKDGRYTGEYAIAQETVERWKAAAGGRGDEAEDEAVRFVCQVSLFGDVMRSVSLGVKAGTWMPEGIQTNVPNAVLGTGWNLHFQEPYSHRTRSADLDPGKGKYLLVAARKVGSGTMALAAVGERAAVLKETHAAGDPYYAAQCHLHRGTYWYNASVKMSNGTVYRSFGFLLDGNLRLNCVDQADGDTRLCWFSDGGYRVGNTKRLKSLTDWEKLVYWSDGPLNPGPHLS